MRLARVNTGLFIAIIAVNVFVIVLPLMPIVTLWLRQHTTNTAERLRVEMHDTSPDTTPTENRLVIPRILYSEEILEGPNAATLDRGIWRRPHTSTPTQGSNTVITGHRFTYSNPYGTFYHLDKLQPGDEIGVYWEGKKYIYSVTDTFVVSPDAVHIEAPTDSSLLTLYTCTPLWRPTDRLVVTAELQSATPGAIRPPQEMTL